MFPDKSGGLALYAHEALAEVLDARRADRDVRLLDRRGRSSSPSTASSSARSSRGLVPGRAVRRGEQQPGRDRLLLDRHGQGRAAAADRHRPDPRGLALQRARRPYRRVVRLPRRRAAHGAAVRDDDPAVPQRQLRQREPRQHDQGDRPGLGWAPALDRLVMADVLVGLGGGRLCDLCARVQGHGARHEARAALGGALLALRLHPAPDRLRRRWHRRAGERVRLRRRDESDRGLDDAHRLLRRLSRRRVHHHDEHGDGGRRAGALRHLARPA